MSQVLNFPWRPKTVITAPLAGTVLDYRPRILLGAPILPKKAIDIIEGGIAEIVKEAALQAEDAYFAEAFRTLCHDLKWSDEVAVSYAEEAV